VFKTEQISSLFFQGMIRRIIVSGYLTMSANAAFVPY